MADAKIAGCDMAWILSMIWALPLCREALPTKLPEVRVSRIGRRCRKFGHYDPRRHVVTIRIAREVNGATTMTDPGHVIDGLVQMVAELLVQQVSLPLLLTPRGLAIIADTAKGQDGDLRAFHQCQREAFDVALAKLREQFRVATMKWAEYAEARLDALEAQTE